MAIWPLHPLQSHGILITPASNEGEFAASLVREVLSYIFHTNLNPYDALGLYAIAAAVVNLPIPFKRLWS